MSAKKALNDYRIALMPIQHRMALAAAIQRQQRNRRLTIITVCVVLITVKVIL